MQVEDKMFLFELLRNLSDTNIYVMSYILEAHDGILSDQKASLNLDFGQILAVLLYVKKLDLAVDLAENGDQLQQQDFYGNGLDKESLVGLIF